MRNPHDPALAALTFEDPIRRVLCALAPSRLSRSWKRQATLRSSEEQHKGTGGDQRRAPDEIEVNPSRPQDRHADLFVNQPRQRARQQEVPQRVDAN